MIDIALKFGRWIAHLSLARQLRRCDVELHHVGERQLAAVVEVRRRILQVAQRRRLELSDRRGEPLIDGAVLDIRADDGVRFACGFGMSPFIYTFHRPRSAYCGLPATAGWRKLSVALGWLAVTGR